MDDSTAIETPSRNQSLSRQLLHVNKPLKLCGYELGQRSSSRRMQISKQSLGIGSFQPVLIEEVRVATSRVADVRAWHGLISFFVTRHSTGELAEVK